MLEIAMVAAGGAIGASARWWVGGLLADRFGMFPWHTLVVNVTGAFLLGVLMGVPADRGLVTGSFRLFAGIGVLGGYTTFSTLSYESVQLIEQGLVAQGVANMGVSALAGLAAVAAGLFLGRAL